MNILIWDDKSQENRHAEKNLISAGVICKGVYLFNFFCVLSYLNESFKGKDFPVSTSY